MNFRKTILAMAMLALFTGLASAQVVVGGNTGATAGPLQCTANVAVPNQLRAEGLTELVGDIVLTCTGGASLAPGAVVPTANITVSLTTRVTSWLMSCASGTTCSEATLLIDEPNTAGSGQLGPGPSSPYNYCNNTQGSGPGGTCTQIVSAGGAVPAGQSGTGCAVGGTGCTAAFNAYSGVVNGNQVIFNGIPVNPPTTGGFARVYRITNVRANVSALGVSSTNPGTFPLPASISISGSTSLPVTNPVQTTGFIQNGLVTSVRNTTGGTGSTNTAFPQCGGSTSPVPVGVLRFAEGFGTAFKTRVTPTAAPGSGQLGGAIQNIPGQIYNSEGGLQPNFSAAPTVGIADFGTRLKAVFNNVPQTTRIFVSVTNVAAQFNIPVANPGVGNSLTPFAQLVSSETGSFNTVPGNAISNTAVELLVVNGTATAVWEVVNTNPQALENLDFGIWQQFAANPGANTPPVGQALVNLSFAPTPPAFSATDGGSASSTLPIPRFADTSGAGTNLFRIALCNTVLLFPFVTNQAGFDTGLAIANTTTDPFGTRTQNGTCVLNFFGASAPPPVTTPNIPTGTVFTGLASISASGFQGYMIAVCNFQLAHGFAFVSDIGARDIAMGYLALIVPTGTDNRNNITEALNN